MFFKIGVPKSFSHFIGKHLCRSLLLITLQVLRLATLIKRDSILSFPVKLAKFLRRPPVAASEFCSGGCVTIVSASSIRCISNQCIKVNLWSLVWCCIDFKIMPELDIAHSLLSLFVFKHGFIQIRFGIFELFFFYFRSNKYYLMLFRSSHRSCYVRKGVLRNFAKFTGKHLCHLFFLIKLQAEKKRLWHRGIFLWILWNF